MSAFIVEKGMKGFSTGKIEDKMGIRCSETAELFFDDCRVPAANRLGEEGKGFGIAMGSLDGARVGVGAIALGLAEGALEESLSYVNQRVQFGKPIAALQGIQWYIADMATEIRSRKMARIPCRISENRRQALYKRSVNGKTFLLQDGKGSNKPRYADPWRIRIYEGVCRRENVQGR